MEEKNYGENPEQIGSEPVNADNGVGDDAFIIGKGFEIAETEEQNQPKKSKKNKYSGGKSTLKTLIWVLCIIVVSVGLAFGAIYAGADYMGLGFGRGVECTVEIKQGMATAQIASELEECGAVKMPYLFRLYAKLKHYDSQFKYGVYTFNNEAGYEALSEMLIEEGARADSVHVTIPEGSSVDDIATLLENNGVCSKSDFINEVQNGSFDYDFVKGIPEDTVYYRLEGYLFPDSYDFYNYDSKECAHLAVDTMLKTLDKKLTDELRKKIADSSYSLHEIMTMASIVEAESGGSSENMTKVAAVFFNRLASDEFQKLESSPTVKYPYGGGRYNTYICKGLPPGPFNCPGIAAVQATLSPEPNFDYYYFVTDAKMKFYFNKTLSEHNATIARLKKENNWIGDQ